MLASGWMTDRVFKGRGGRACFFSMAMCLVCLLAFWKLPLSSTWLSAALLCGVGFFIYGPQCLVGVVAANAATRRAAATAIGVTGLFGYLSGVLSGWGLGRMADAGGWDPVFGTLAVSAAIATVLFAMLWNAGQKIAE
jgi:OPA family glycerol-3-phosphate transporter-like MFS transporter/OPA family sugar phosphate sensor protein UhpC-like MFS transporter